MMNILLIAAALGAATPAVAHTNDAFTGARVELNAGHTNFNHVGDLNDVDYGLAVGYDVRLNDRFTLGAEATVQNAFSKNSRQLGVGARLGYAITPDLLGFARVGYTNLDRYNLDGVNFGGGLNYRIAHNVYISGEYRRTEFQHNVSSDAALVGVGLRF